MKSDAGSSGAQKTEKWASCYEFWLTIDESVAETLPEDCDSRDGGMDPIMTVDLVSQASDPYESPQGFHERDTGITSSSFYRRARSLNIGNNLLPLTEM
jgi:hypothetical protein